MKARVVCKFRVVGDCGKVTVSDCGDVTIGSSENLNTVAEVFVGSGIFKSGDPARRAAAIVKAATHFNDPAQVLEASKNLGEAMVGINISDLPENELLAGRGW